MEWFENEAHWKTLYPLLFDERRFASACEEVEEVIRFAKLSPPAAVLDLGCGPARHSVILAQKGFDVTGVDRSSYLIKKAEEHMKAANVLIDLVKADMRQSVRPRKYELILNLYTSFGYFRDRTDDLAVVRNVKDSLKPGGMFILETLSKDYLVGKNCPTRWEELPDGTLSVQHYEVQCNWSRLQIDVKVNTNRAVRYFRSCE